VLDKLPIHFRGASQESRFCVEMVQAPEVFDRLIKLRPYNLTLWNTRGRYYASSGEWAKTAADYRKSLELLTPMLSSGGEDDGLWIEWGVMSHELGALLLLSGDESGYRHL
jgi:hypothetical protein